MMMRPVPAQHTMPTTPPRRGRPTLTPRGAATVVPLLLLALVWAIHLEATLPAARVPAGATALPPGAHTAIDAPLALAGDWFTQPLDDVTSLVTEQPGGSATFRFHGTHVVLTLRVGPESGRAYVTVDGKPVPGLPSDERGSFVRLRAEKAADRPIIIATGLAHGEHVMTIANGNQGQLAISAITIKAQTPLPWSFGLFYAGCLLLLGVAIRTLAWEGVRRLRWASDAAGHRSPGDVP
ncbi:MAG: hypothetical protein QJR03_11065 [Sphaerobacter sp.]|nr:hypothetical protein [Sphaerobacter sp.]